MDIKEAIAKRDYRFNAGYSLLSKEAKKRVEDDFCNIFNLKPVSFRLRRIGRVVMSTIESDVLRELFKKEGITKVYNYEYEAD